MENRRDSARDVNVATKELWEEGRDLEAGRLLFESLPKDEQPRWAAAILDLTTQWLDVWMCGVWELQRVAKKRRRWRGAYSAFQMIRNTTLRLEARKARKALTPKQDRMLCQCGVAENVAKVIYNATNPVNPFDEDAGWWIVPNVKSCVDCLSDPAFEEAVTSFLFHA